MIKAHQRGNTPPCTRGPSLYYHCAPRPVSDKEHCCMHRTLLDKTLDVSGFFSRNRLIKYTQNTFEIMPLPVNRSFIGPSRRTDGFGMVKTCEIDGIK